MRVDSQLLATSTRTTSSLSTSRGSVNVAPPRFLSASADTLPLPVDDDETSSLLKDHDFPVHPDEPNLYQIPVGLNPIYRPLPIFLRICVWVLAALTSTALTRNIGNGKSLRLSIPKIATILLKAWILSALGNGVLQETLSPPTRISTRQLIDQYVLPSTLSRYDTVQSLGVHYLQYKAKSGPPPRFQAIYVNHGFGASSLSWLPALPKMVDRLRARVGLGHDAVGFGFTDRPKDFTAFQPMASANIGMALLKKQQLEPCMDEPILLVGHSMGSLATLLMALSLPKTIQKQLVLVAPALGMRPASNRKQLLGDTANHRKNLFFFQRAAEFLAEGAGFFGRYGLRRLVGGRNFWRKGLKLAWGNPKRLLDGDVLRFQWPSIGLGWEDGILQFSRAMLRPTSFTDGELIERALESNATITVILGGNDRVVPSQSVKKFLKPYGDRIRIVEMEGLGHDPFEEDVDGFVHVVEQLLNEEEYTSMS